MEAVYGAPSRGQGPAITASNLSISFGPRRTVLSALSFVVEPGSVVAIMGPSGCGKTTLLRILAGLEAGYSGSVEVSGKSLPQALLGTQIGIAFQDPTLLPWRNVRNNILLPLQIRRCRDTGQIDRLLDLLRLRSATDLLPHELSGGMAQRIAVARALAASPKVLLLDEPFASLDWFLRKSIVVDLATVLKETQATTLMVTHEAREAAYLADTIMILGGQPSQILATVPVPFTASRSSSLFTSGQFHRFCDEVDQLCERCE